MPTMTVKNIPPDIYELLKQSAAANRRSINSEIITYIERGVRGRKVNAEDLLMRARAASKDQASSHYGCYISNCQAGRPTMIVVDTNLIGYLYLQSDYSSLAEQIAAFFQTDNTGQTEGFNDLFTDDARVSDEEHEYRGAAIKEWIDEAIAKNKPNAEATDLLQAGDKTSVTAQVSGHLPGKSDPSPLQLHPENGKIAALAIRT